MADKENKNVENEGQEYDVDPILGDDTDESEKIAEMLRNSQTLSSAEKSGDADNDETGADLDDFLDEPDSGAGIDPELDDALSQFVDGDAPESSENQEATEEIDEELKQKLEEEKVRKIKKIRKISLVGSLAVFAVAIILVIAVIINSHTLRYVLTYSSEIDGRTQNQRVSINDFQALMDLLSNPMSFDPVDDALNFLLESLTIARAANSRNLRLSEDERLNAREWAESYRDFAAPNASLEFLEMIYASNSYLFMQLFDGILDEVGFVLDEEEYALELANFINNSKSEYIDAEFKFIIAPSEEVANEVKAAIVSGEMTIDEALIAFVYTEAFAIENGFESLAEILELYELETIEEFVANFGVNYMDLQDMAWMFEFEQGDVEHLLSLEIDQMSNVIRYDGYDDDLYLLFILESIYIPSDEEIEEMFRERYMDFQKMQIFHTEFEIWQEELMGAVRINQRALDSIYVPANMGGFPWEF